MDAFKDTEEIILDGFKTTIGELMYSLIEKVPLENIEEVRIFGSYLTRKTRIEIRREGWFFQKEIKYETKILPEDIDILIIVKSVEGIVRLKPPITGRVLEFGDVCGYGYSFWASGIKSGPVHLIVVSRDHYQKAISQGDEIALSMEGKNRIIYTKGMI